jgi:hypothetical protein
MTFTRPLCGIDYAAISGDRKLSISFDERLFVKQLTGQSHGRRRGAARCSMHPISLEMHP